MREPIVIGWPTTQTDTDLSLHGTCQIQGSGCVEFEEFLQWFHSHFLKEKPPARSLHSSMPQISEM